MTLRDKNWGPIFVIFASIENKLEVKLSHVDLYDVQGFVKLA